MTITDLTTQDVAAGLADGSLLLVDVREPHEFAAGHIPGSVLVPLSSFDAADVPVNSGRRVVFYCAAGVRSVRAVEMAQRAGLPLDTHYKGGFKAWASAGMPIAR